MNFIAPTPKGMIDDSLTFLVTSLQLSAVGVNTLPSWMWPYIPVPSYGPRYVAENGSNRRLPKYHELEDETGIDFIGSKINPMKRVSAFGLPEDLAILGYVASNFSIYIRRIHGGEPVYRLNIFWKRPSLDPSDTLEENILSIEDLFYYLQLEFAWNVIGTEFRNRRRDYRCIVLDFRARQPIVPSLRAGKVVVRDNQVTMW